MTIEGGGLASDPASYQEEFTKGFTKEHSPRYVTLDISSDANTEGLLQGRGVCYHGRCDPCMDIPEGLQLNASFLYNFNLLLHDTEPGSDTEQSYRPFKSTIAQV